MVRRPIFHNKSKAAKERENYEATTLSDLTSLDRFYTTESNDVGRSYDYTNKKRNNYDDTYTTDTYDSRLFEENNSKYRTSDASYTNDDYTTSAISYEETKRRKRARSPESKSEHLYRRRKSPKKHDYHSPTRKYDYITPEESERKRSKLTRNPKRRNYYDSPNESEPTTKKTHSPRRSRDMDSINEDYEKYFEKAKPRERSPEKSKRREKRDYESFSKKQKEKQTISPKKARDYQIYAYQETKQHEGVFKHKKTQHEGSLLSSEIEVKTHEYPMLAFKDTTPGEKDSDMVYLPVIVLDKKSEKTGPTDVPVSKISPVKLKNIQVFAANLPDQQNIFQNLGDVSSQKTQQSHAPDSKIETPSGLKYAGSLLGSIFNYEDFSSKPANLTISKETKGSMKESILKNKDPITYQVNVDIAPPAQSVFGVERPQDDLTSTADEIAYKKIEDPLHDNYPVTKDYIKVSENMSEQQRKSMVNEQQRQDMTSEQNNKSFTSEQQRKSLIQRQSMVNPELQQNMLNEQLRKSMVSEQTQRSMISEQQRQSMANEQPHQSIGREQSRKSTLSEQQHQNMVNEQLEPTMFQEQSRRSMFNYPQHSSMIGGQPRQSMVSRQTWRSIADEQSRKSMRSQQRKSMIGEQRKSMVGEKSPQKLSSEQSRKSTITDQQRKSTFKKSLMSPVSLDMVKERNVSNNAQSVVIPERQSIMKRNLSQATNEGNYDEVISGLEKRGTWMDGRSLSVDVGSKRGSIAIASHLQPESEIEMKTIPATTRLRPVPEESSPEQEDRNERRSGKQSMVGSISPQEKYVTTTLIAPSKIAESEVTVMSKQPELSISKKSTVKSRKSTVLQRPSQATLKTIESKQNESVKSQVPLEKQTIVISQGQPSSLQSKASASAGKITDSRFPTVDKADESHEALQQFTRQVFQLDTANLESKEKTSSNEHFEREQGAITPSRGTIAPTEPLNQKSEIMKEEISSQRGNTRKSVEGALPEKYGTVKQSTVVGAQSTSEEVRNRGTVLSEGIGLGFQERTPRNKTIIENPEEEKITSVVDFAGSPGQSLIRSKSKSSFKNMTSALVHFGKKKSVMSQKPYIQVKPVSPSRTPTIGKDEDINNSHFIQSNEPTSTLYKENKNRERSPTLKSQMKEEKARLREEKKEEKARIKEDQREAKAKAKEERKEAKARAKASKSETKLRNITEQKSKLSLASSKSKTELKEDEYGSKTKIPHSRNKSVWGILRRSKSKSQIETPSTHTYAPQYEALQPQLVENVKTEGPYEGPEEKITQKEVIEKKSSKEKQNEKPKERPEEKSKEKLEEKPCQCFLEYIKVLRDCGNFFIGRNLHQEVMNSLKMF